MKGPVEPALAMSGLEEDGGRPSWSSKPHPSFDPKLLGGTPKFTHYRRRKTNKAPRKRTFIMHMTKYPNILMKTVGNAGTAPGGGGGGGRLKGRALPRSYLHTSGISGTGVGEGAGRSFVEPPFLLADLNILSSVAPGLLLLSAALPSAVLYVQGQFTAALVATAIQTVLSKQKQAAEQKAAAPKVFSPFASAFSQAASVSSELQSAFAATDSAFATNLAPSAGIERLPTWGSAFSMPARQNSELSTTSFEGAMLISRSPSLESDEDFTPAGGKRLRLQDGSFVQKSDSLASNVSSGSHWNGSSTGSLTSPYLMYTRRTPFTLRVASASASTPRASRSVITCRKVIGSGAYGRVYRATWAGRTVAVKLPAEEMHHNGEDAELSTEDILASFQNEAEVLALLAGHDNILSGQAVQIDGGAACIVSDYASWGTLSDYLHQSAGRDWAALEELVLTALAQQHGFAGSTKLLEAVAASRTSAALPMSPRRYLTAVALLQQAAAGLAHMSENAVVHRDIKPENILINSNGVAQVCDFGLAQIASSPSAMAERHGTPQYAAPEELRPGQAAVTTAAADVYSFGYCLWEAMSSNCPWEAVPAARVMYTVGQQGAQLAVPESWPASVKAILAGCWQAEPQARPSAADVVVALGAVVAKLF